MTTKQNIITGQVGNSRVLQIPRLHRSQVFNEHLTNLLKPPETTTGPFTSPDHPDLTLTITSPGLLDTLLFVPSKPTTHPLPPNHIIIQHHLRRPQLPRPPHRARPHPTNRRPRRRSLRPRPGRLARATDLQPGDRVAVLTDGHATHPHRGPLPDGRAASPPRCPLRDAAAHPRHGVHGVPRAGGRGAAGDRRERVDPRGRRGDGADGRAARAVSRRGGVCDGVGVRGRRGLLSTHTASRRRMSSTVATRGFASAVKRATGGVGRGCRLE